MLGTAAEKNPRKLMSEPVGSPPLIRSFGKNVCFAQTPGRTDPWSQSTWKDSGCGWRPQLDMVLSSEPFILWDGTASSSHFGGQEYTKSRFHFPLCKPGIAHGRCLTSKLSE